MTDLDAARADPPCTCGHEFSTGGMFHLGDCPRAALPVVDGPTETLGEGDVA